MPSIWTRKDERMYKHIVQSCAKPPRGRRRRSLKVCKRIAASTVNKLRKQQKRTLSGLGCCSCDY